MKKYTITISGEEIRKGVRAPFLSPIKSGAYTLKKGNAKRARKDWKAKGKRNGVSE